MGRMQLVLRRTPAQESELRGLLKAQQEPESAEYHRWLTPDEFGARFGARESDINRVHAWLDAQGFSVSGTGKGRTTIEFSGTAGQVREAFHTEIHRYEIGGVTHWANSSEPQIPNALSPIIAGPALLHDFRAKPMMRMARNRERPDELAIIRPEFNGSPGVHALAPADFATIYNVNPLYAAGLTGAGVVIGVIGVNSVRLSDILDFQTHFGLPSNAPEIVMNGNPSLDWSETSDVEGTLDVEWSNAIAPGASIKYITSPDSDVVGALGLSEQYAVDSNLVDVLTESYGLCEADMTAAQMQLVTALRQQAAAQGITWIVASGDSGPYCDDAGVTAADLGSLTVNGLASSPYNVAVGGTEFSASTNTAVFWKQVMDPTTQESAASYIPEVVWNESCTGSTCGQNAGAAASGGGASSQFDKPWWQSGVVGLPNDGKRDLPDVSFNASFAVDPYLICYNSSCDPTLQFGLYGIGGTSASAPAFAGIVALLVEHEKQRQGAINARLYGLASKEQFGECVAFNPAHISQLPTATCIFNDVTSGDSSVPGEANYGLSTALYPATTGFDLATGLGSINAANLIGQWDSISLQPTTTTLDAAPTSFEHGTPVSIQVSVTPSAGSGTPTGDVGLLTTGLFSGLGTLANGTASFTTSSLPGGSYNLAARYAGDANFASSISEPMPVTVTPEPTQLVAGLSVSGQNPDAFYSGGPFGTAMPVFRANVAGISGQGTPTGEVTVNVIKITTYFLNPDLGAALDINSRGEAIGVPPNLLLDVGSYWLFANYAGDASFQPASAAPALITITRAPTTISVAAFATTIYSGQQAAASATIGFPNQVANAIGQTIPAGTVTFFANGQPLGPPIRADENLIMSSPLPPGPNLITASYSGDSHYLPSTTERAVTVNALSQAAPACDVNEFFADPNPIRFGDPPGTTTLSLFSPCDFDIRVGAPDGPLMTSGVANPLLVFKITVGPWVTDGTTFYLQEKGNTSPQGTLQTITMSVIPDAPPCLAYGFSAAPNPVITASPFGTTRISASASCPFDVRISGPSGAVFTSGVANENGGYSVNATTGNWVTNGMSFFLQRSGDTTVQGTLSTLSVPVGPTTPRCVVKNFSILRGPLLGGELPYLVLMANAGCAFDIRLNSPSGFLVASGQGVLAQQVPVSADYQHPIAYYLQISGDTSPQGTLAVTNAATKPYLGGNVIVHRPGNK